MKILAIVVTYYPEENLLEKNINAFIEYVDKVLIWENTPESERFSFRFIHDEKIEYCGDGVNSISHALNYAWHFAYDNGYDYLLTMDQDSIFEDFRSYLLTIMKTSTPYGIWGPSIVEENVIGIVERDVIITSGMIVPIEICYKVSGWNEIFSIDSVDEDFCFRAKRNGIRAYELSEHKLIHRLGNQRFVSFFNKKHIIYNYSPQRLFSIYKSHIICMRMYPEQKAYKKYVLSFWFGAIKWIFVFESERFKKVREIVRGILSGYLYKINNL